MERKDWVACDKVLQVSTDSQRRLDKTKRSYSSSCRLAETVSRENGRWHCVEAKWTISLLWEEDSQAREGK